AVLHQDGSAGGAHTVVRARILDARPAVDLAVRGVAGLPLLVTLLGEGVGPRGDGLRPQGLGATGVGPAGQCLGGDHAAQVVLDVEAVDGARGGAVEHHAEGTAVGLVV